MILDITSFGWSGSGAYHDLLREYDQTEFPSSGDWEFCLLWDVDGIYDLDHQLCTKSCRIYDSDMAIHRFLNRIKMMMKTPVMGYSSVFKNGFLETRSKQYIESLVDIKFQGRAFNDWIYPTKFDGIIQKYNRILEFCICNRVSRKIFPHYLRDLLINYNPHEFYVSYKPASFCEQHRIIYKILLTIQEKIVTKFMCLTKCYLRIIQNHFINISKNL